MILHLTITMAPKYHWNDYTSNHHHLRRDLLMQERIVNAPKPAGIPGTMIVGIIEAMIADVIEAAIADIIEDISIETNITSEGVDH